MEILVNKNFNKNNERQLFAKEVSNVMKNCDIHANPYLTVEVVNLYNKKISKVRYKNINPQNEGLPFLFEINQN